MTPRKETARSGPVALAAALALALACLPLVLLMPVDAGGTALRGDGREVVALGRGLRVDDGTRVACARPEDCPVLASAMDAASTALDRVLPSPLRFSAVTVLAPTLAGQLAVVGARGAGAPAATTLLVGEDLVRRGVAAPQDRGRVWIVVNPQVVAEGVQSLTEVLIHELVHVRTRAADLSGPLWVEEGYAVALTRLALAKPSAPQPAEDAPRWPDDSWRPTTLADYEVAGAVVDALAAQYGWCGVARWYAATAGGMPSPRAVLQVAGGGCDPGS